MKALAQQLRENLSVILFVSVIALAIVVGFKADSWTLDDQRSVVTGPVTEMAR